jgi:TPR repeat protein
MTRLFSIEVLRKHAKKGDCFAQFALAVAYEYGTGIRQDFRKAHAWYEKAARKGHTSAKNNLYLLEVGQSNLDKAKKAFLWFKSEAKKGDVDAQNNLGLCYFFGRGVRQNYTHSQKWYKRAALAGSAMAQFNLGGLYFNGHGVRRNYSTAAKWYTKAAQQREELALLQLASMYQKGLEIDPYRPCP